MFDIGWTEMIVVAIVAILVVGPKDLPKMLRAFGKTVSNLRSMAGDFQRQFNEALKEAELDEVKDIAQGKGFAPLDDARKSMEAFQKKVETSVNEPVSAIGEKLVVDDSAPEPESAAAEAGARMNGKTVGGGPAAKPSEPVKGPVAAKAAKPAKPRTAAKKPAPKPESKPAGKPAGKTKAAGSARAPAKRATKAKAGSAAPGANA